MIFRALTVVLLVAAAGLQAQDFRLQDNAITPLSRSGTAVGLTADLSGLESALAKSLVRSYLSDSCGDQVRVTNINLAALANDGQLFATMEFARVNCVKYTEPVCKGFVCRQETRITRRTVYQTTIPIAVTVTPNTTANGLDFKMSSDMRSADSKQLLGNDAYYNRVAQEISAQLTTELTPVADQLVRIWRRRMASYPIDRATAAFVQRAPGALRLEITAAR